MVGKPFLHERLSLDDFVDTTLDRLFCGPNVMACCVGGRERGEGEREKDVENVEIAKRTLTKT